MVQVALGEQLFLDAAFDAFTEQEAVRKHHGSAAALFQQVHDQHQKQVSRFAGTEGGREVGFDTVLFHATERRVGDDTVDPPSAPS